MCVYIKLIVSIYALIVLTMFFLYLGDHSLLRVGPSAKEVTFILALLEGAVS
jgi:hypothetical protein